MQRPFDALFTIVRTALIEREVVQNTFLRHGRDGSAWHPSYSDWIVQMRLLDNSHRKPTRTVALYLTSFEAERLMDRLGWLLAHPGDHFHMKDDAGREISASIYDEAALRDPARKARYNRIEREMFDAG